VSETARSADIYCITYLKTIISIENTVKCSGKHWENTVSDC
jgi:hypothetical protein